LKFGKNQIKLKFPFDFMEGKKATIVIPPFSSLFLLSLLNSLIISLVSSLFMDGKTYFANN
jgi:hypothetical protein